MRAFDYREERNNNVPGIITASLDMDSLPGSLPEQYARQFALIQRAQASYRLLYDVMRELSAAYDTARRNNDPLHIWPPVQASIKQIELFLQPPLHR
jgi:hypothetical protein